jgi:hypothetical protein
VGILAGITAAALAGGGAAATAGAAGQKTGYNRQYFGGSPEELERLRQEQAARTTQARGATDTAAGNIVGTATMAQDDANQQAQQIEQLSQSVGRPTFASDPLANYDPGMVARAQAQAALQQQARATLGSGFAGGAVGLRNAVNANAEATVNAAPAIAAAAGGAANDQALAQSQQQVARAQLDQQYAGRVLQGQQVGLNARLAGAGLQADAQRYTGDVNQNREQLYTGQSQDTNSQQFQGDQQAEARRQAAALEKQKSLFQLGGNLIGGAGRVAGAG